MCIGKRADDRKCCAGAYRYGFNGKEKDEDGEWGSTTHYDYGFRIYNPAIGKFLSVDPLTQNYPWYTPYQFAGNKPINSIDVDGLEEFASYEEYVVFANKKGMKVLNSDKMWEQGSWLESDRLGKVVSYNIDAIHKAGINDNFRKAAVVNTGALRSDKYIDLPQRRAYYEALNDYFEDKGFEVKWMNAADATVATLNMALSPAASWINNLADYGSNEEIRNFIREGNKVILDDMMSKIDELSCSHGLKGAEAKVWDAQTLSDEQNLIQPYYESLSSKSIEILENNLELKYPGTWEGDVLNASDRWKFGMKLMDYDVKSSEMPSPTSSTGSNEEEN